MTKIRICASRRALHWNSPMSAPQSNLSSWTIERFRKPQIRTGGRRSSAKRRLATRHDLALSRLRCGSVANTGRR